MIDTFERDLGEVAIIDWEDDAEDVGAWADAGAFAATDGPVDLAPQGGAPR